MLGSYLTLIVSGAVVLLALLVLYYSLLVRAILQMLGRETNMILLFFSFLALIPSPFTLIMGILILVIWKLHRKTLPEAL